MATLRAAETEARAILEDARALLEKALGARSEAVARRQRHRRSLEALNDQLRQVEAELDRRGTVPERLAALEARFGGVIDRAAGGRTPAHQNTTPGR